MLNSTLRLGVTSNVGSKDKFGCSSTLVKECRRVWQLCGTAFGFGQSRLLLAANVNQIMKLGFDDAHDVFNIKRGIQIYNNR